MGAPILKEVVEWMEDTLETIQKTTDAENWAAWEAPPLATAGRAPFAADPARHGPDSRGAEPNEPKWGAGWAKTVYNAAAGTRARPLKDAGAGRLATNASDNARLAPESDRRYLEQLEEDRRNAPMASQPPPRAVAEAAAEAEARAAAKRAAEAPPRPKHNPPSKRRKTHATSFRTPVELKAAGIASNLQQPPRALLNLFNSGLLHWDEFKLKDRYVGVHEDEEARAPGDGNALANPSLISLMYKLRNAKERLCDARNVGDDDKIVHERAGVAELEAQLAQLRAELRAPRVEQLRAAHRAEWWTWKKCLRVHDGSAFGSVIALPEVRELLLQCGLTKSPDEPFWWLDAEHRTPAPNSFCTIFENAEHRGPRPPSWKRQAPPRRTANFFCLAPDNGFGPLVGPKTPFQRAPAELVVAPEAVATVSRTMILKTKIVPRAPHQDWDDVYDMEPEAQAAFAAARAAQAECDARMDAKVKEAAQKTKAKAAAEEAEAERAKPRLAKNVEAKSA